MHIAPHDLLDPRPRSGVSWTWLAVLLFVAGFWTAVALLVARLDG